MWGALPRRPGHRAGDSQSHQCRWRLHTPTRQRRTIPRHSGLWCAGGQRCQRNHEGRRGACCGPRVVARGGPPQDRRWSLGQGHVQQRRRDGSHVLGGEPEEKQGACKFPCGVRPSGPGVLGGAGLRSGRPLWAGLWPLVCLPSGEVSGRFAQEGVMTQLTLTGVTVALPRKTGSGQCWGGGGMRSLLRGGVGSPGQELEGECTGFGTGCEAREEGATRRARGVGRALTGRWPPGRLQPWSPCAHGSRPRSRPFSWLFFCSTDLLSCGDQARPQSPRGFIQCISSLEALRVRPGPHRQLF